MMVHRIPSILLALMLAACASEEQRICQQEAAYPDGFGAMMKGHEAEFIKSCVEIFAHQRKDMSDEQYAEFKRCRLAATDNLGSTKCLFDSAFKEGEAKLAEAFKPYNDAADGAIARLEALVPGGAVDAATIAAIRAGRENTPPGRLTAVCNDAVALIEAGRIAPDTKLQVHLPRGLASAEPTPTGPDAAELVFTDRATSRVVARVAPIPEDHLGMKDDEIAALLTWLIADPGKRDIELVVDTKTQEKLELAAPTSLATDPEGLAAAGLTDRKLLIVDGTPMTLAQWRART